MPAWRGFGYGQQGAGSTSQQSRIVGESASADSRPSEHCVGSPVSSTPKRRKAADQMVRQATTLQLTSLLQGMSGGANRETSSSFPWSLVGQHMILMLQLQDLQDLSCLPDHFIQ